MHLLAEAADIARTALAEGIVLASGNVFSPAQTAGRFLRFNVTQCADPCIFQTLGRAINYTRCDGAQA